MKMSMKFDEEGKVVISDNGMPVWIKEEENGEVKEIVLDVPKMVRDLNAANGESAGRRKKIEELEQRLQPFEGFDVEAAKKALETVKTYNENQKIQAGKTDEVIKAVEDTYKKQLDEQQRDLTSKLAEKDVLVQKKTKQINDLLVKGIFTSSKYLSENSNLPPEVAFAYFGKNFKVEEKNGVPSAVAYYEDDRMVYSDKVPGTPAETEEALELLIKNCTFRDSILKGSGGSGTGAGSPGGKADETPKSLGEMLYSESMAKKK
jgi:hypothetical protein